MSRSSQAGGGAGNGGGGAGNGGSDTPRHDWVPAVLVSALAVVTVASVVFSYCAFDQLMYTKREAGAGGDEDVEERVKMEIRQRLEEKEVPCAGKWAISRPVMFRSGVGDKVAGQIDKKSIRRFMEQPALRKAEKVYVFGFASADGPRDVNELLARQRARTVKKVIRRHYSPIDVKVDELGEDHLTEGVASSRSARIVACVPCDRHGGRKKSARPREAGGVCGTIWGSRFWKRGSAD